MSHSGQDGSFFMPPCVGRRNFITKSRRNASGGENPANIVFKYDNATPAILEENTKVIRLAEVYLIRAEARAQQAGKEATALADLNVLIARADPTATPLVGLTGVALLDVVLNERRRELAFEGHRIFDLNRFKKSFIKYRASKVTQNITYPNTKIIFPIPQREIDANKNMVQNPGY